MTKPMTPLDKLLTYNGSSYSMVYYNRYMTIITRFYEGEANDQSAFVLNKIFLKPFICRRNSFTDSTEMNNKYPAFVGFPFCIFGKVELKISSDSGIDLSWSHPAPTSSMHIRTKGRWNRIILIAS